MLLSALYETPREDLFYPIESMAAEGDAVAQAPSGSGIQPTSADQKGLLKESILELLCENPSLLPSNAAEP